MKTYHSFIFIICLAFFVGGCNKNKNKKAVVANSAAVSASSKLEAAIDARLGIYKLEAGTINGITYSPLDAKQISITKVTPSKIRIAPVGNLAMGTYEIEVTNGTSALNGNVIGSNDGKAIGYVGTLAVGQIIFGCEEDDSYALIVTGTGINSVSIGGSK